MTKAAELISTIINEAMMPSAVKMAMMKYQGRLVDSTPIQWVIEFTRSHHAEQFEKFLDKGLYDYRESGEVGATRVYTFK